MIEIMLHVLAWFIFIPLCFAASIFTICLLSFIIEDFEDRARRKRIQQRDKEE